MHKCMNWRAITFDWNRARAFLVTAEEGSLSAAALALGMTQPTLSRQVAALEEELGTTLFERRGRGLELTAHGLALLRYVQAMGDAANSFSLAANGRASAIEGTITLSASEVTAAFILPPILDKLRHRYPGIRVDLVATNQASDLKRRDADIAIRHFRPAEPDLIARKLGTFAAGLFATPTYLDQLGRPQRPEGLANARFIGFSSSNPAFRQALGAHGLSLTEAQFVVNSDSHLIQWQMARQGLGIGVVPVEIGEADPGMERLLPRTAFTGDVWLVSHRELKTNLRVRTTFDFLADALIEHLDQAKRFT